LKTIRELFEEGKVLLGEFSDSSLESRLLLCKSVSLSEEDFYAEGDSHATREQQITFLRLIAERQSGIPLAYLTKVKEFWSIPLEVYPGVLIPRPETELIVEKVIDLSSRRESVIVDIGTGCGNIAVALAKEFPKAQIIATDVSGTAVRVAKANAAQLNISNINIVQGSVAAPLEKLKLYESCDFIVSNPPYVSEEEWETLPLEIRAHEPKKALVAGETGLEFIRALVKGIPEFLKPGGYLVFEMGWGQRQRVLKMFSGAWSCARSFKDLHGIPRVIAARKRYQ
jgi:release factor glutamine methyltransferase